MIKIWINGVKYEVKEGLSIMKACEMHNIVVSRFCYNERLSISGNCRMCMVEVVGVGKSIVSCVEKVRDNMRVWTVSAQSKRSSSGVIEMILGNHPLDCAICDQGGECDLQSVSMLVGNEKSRVYNKTKREVRNKDIGILVKTEMQRCIQCSRCVRYMSKMVGDMVIGMIGRSENVEVSNYGKSKNMNKVSGNVIELCPVGMVWES